MQRILLSIPILAALFATGAAGLVNQVVWQRYIARLLGSGHVATAVTLALFLAGLSLGAALAGRWTERVRRPLLAYSVLEAGIGCWGFLFPTFFALAERLLGRPGAGTSGWVVAEGIFAAALLILPPTILMGGTIPFLTRATAGSGERAGSVHAALYAVNTLGALAGVLVAAFVLLPRLGLPESCRATALANLGAAAVFALLSAATRRSDFHLAGGLESAPPDRPPLAPFAVATIAFLTGGATMLLENALSRVVALSVGGSVQAFALVVAAFVLGIAAGGGAVSRARRVSRWALPGVLLGSSALFLALSPFLDTFPYWNHVVRIGFASSPSGWTGYWSAIFLLLSALLLVPVALLGAALPLLFHEGAVTVEQSGRRSGALLSANALGSLVGSLAGGVFFYSQLGTIRVYLLAPLLLAVAAPFALPADPRRTGGRGGRFVAPAILVAAALVFLAGLPGVERDRLAQGTFRLRSERPDSYAGPAGFERNQREGVTTVSFAEDPTATVAVLEFPLAAPAGEPLPSERPRAIFVNGKSDSSTVGDMTTMKLSAHLPALLAREPRQALVVGLGTGVSAGELTLHPGLRRIDVFEISPAVIGALPHFAKWTRGAGSDPRVAIHAGDAMIQLRRSTSTWDLVSSEPSNPWVAGVDQLFSTEFYELVRDHLAPGGTFLQWFHLYESNLDLVGTLASTIHGVFPHVVAFRGSPRDILLVASREPIERERWELARARLEASPGLRESLAAIDAETVEKIWGRRVGGFDALLARCAIWPPNTLDQPRLQPMAARAMFAGSGVDEHEFGTSKPIGALLGDAFAGLWDPKARNPGDAFAKALIERAMAERRRLEQLPAATPDAAPKRSE